MEKICQSGLLQSKKSASNIVSIDFHTDPINYDSTFQLHYEMVAGPPGCGGHFTSTNGTISSPTLHDGNVENVMCLYLIEQPVGTYVKFEFTEFDRSSYRNCSDQSIEVSFWCRHTK